MTLYVGRHMVGMNQKREPQTYQPVEPVEWEPADPKGESHVEFEIVDMSSLKSDYTGKFDEAGNGIYEETIFVKLRKVH